MVLQSGCVCKWGRHIHVPSHQGSVHWILQTIQTVRNLHGLKTLQQLQDLKDFPDDSDKSVRERRVCVVPKHKSSFQGDGHFLGDLGLQSSTSRFEFTIISAKKGRDCRQRRHEPRSSSTFVNSCCSWTFTTFLSVTMLYLINWTLTCSALNVCRTIIKLGEIYKDRFSFHLHRWKQLLTSIPLEEIPFNWQM